MIERQRNRERNRERERESNHDEENYIFEKYSFLNLLNNVYLYCQNENIKKLKTHIHIHIIQKVLKLWF